jgi:sensor domain CHASE-containing protein
MILIWIGIILTWFLTLQHIKSLINKERKKLKSQIKNKVNMFHFNNIKSKVEELRKPGITTQIKPEEYLDYDHLAKIALKNLALS